MSNPTDLKYSKEHEWVRIEGDVAVIGITEYASESLGDVVYVDLPDVGTAVEQFAKFGEVESVKAVSDLFSPVAGEIVEVNGDLAGEPATVNSAPYQGGWLIKVKLTDTAQLDALMDASQYEQFTAE